MFEEQRNRFNHRIKRRHDETANIFTRNSENRIVMIPHQIDCHAGAESADDEWMT